MLEKLRSYHSVSNDEIQTHSYGICQSLNKILAEQLFKVQHAKELNDPQKVSPTWVKHLYGLVDHLNGTKTQMIGMFPKDMTGLKEVPLINQEDYPAKDTLPEDG